MMYQPKLPKSPNSPSTEHSVVLSGKVNSIGAITKKIDTSLQRRKLPLGAIVSPLSPFFNERAKNSAVEQAKANFMEEALQKLNKSAENQPSRFRSRSQSSESKDSEGSSSANSCGASSFASSDSSDSSQSFATAISQLEDQQLPQSLPRISYDEWSKFGISLFTPTLINPHSQMHYHYPCMEKNKSIIPSHLRGNRPRSKSSVTYSASSHRVHEEADRRLQPSIHIPSQSAASNGPHSPLSRNPLVRCNSLRYPMDRNHTSY